MGWVGESWRVGALLDAHGGAKEQNDEALWRELVGRLIAVCQDPKYASLMLDPDELLRESR